MDTKEREEQIYVGRPEKPSWWMFWDRKAKRLHHWWVDIFGDVEHVTWDEYVLEWQLHSKEWKDSV